MSTTNRNEYTVTYADQTTQTVIALDVEELAQAFEDPSNPINQISIVRRSVPVVGILPGVEFQVNVTGTGASAAGCVGTPSDYTVDPGTDVIFQAVAVAGFTFVGWYKNSVLITADAITTITVAAPAIEGQIVQYEARFAPT